MHALNFHHAEVDKPRVSDVRRVESLARKALKHIPGGLEAIERHFNQAPIKQGFKEEAPKNLILHMGHSR